MSIGTIAKLSALMAIASGVSTSSASAVRESWLSRELAGRTAGAAVDCIDLARVDGPMIVDQHTILYRQSGKRIWRADIGDTCPSLREDVVLITHPTDSRLCRNDRFTPLERGSRIPGATCRFGKFVPYDKP